MTESQTFSTVEYANIPLPKKPCLAPWVSFVYLGDDKLQFRGSNFAFTLTHALLIGAFLQIRDLLNGCHEVEEIASSGGEAYFPTTITFLLKMLRAHGVLHEFHSSFSSTENSLEKRQVLFLSHLLQDPGQVNNAFLNSKLGLIGEGPLAEEIELSLTSIGMKKISRFNLDNWKNDLETEKLEFIIACRESPSYSFFEEINTKCLEAGTRWMHIALEGAMAYIGPTIVPYQTACYKCLSARIETLVPDLESHLAFKKEHNERPQDEGYFSPLGKIISSHVTMELTRIFMGYSSPKTFGRYYKLDADDMVPSEHNVLRFPRCSACYNKKSPMDIWESTLVS
ncbi:MAG: TOMM precursor leader peptide-binding protein [Nitrospinae bacterium]|nr:TOMM precursor leader peptide-binding protein [Nitrospinota bacterium]